jgi:hypothetical protein
MKRNFILTFLACGASLMLGVAAQAQSPALVSSTTTTTGTAGPAWTPGELGGHKHGHGRGHGGILAHLTNALALSGSQQAEIAPILEAAKPQMKAIHDNAEAARKTLIDSVSAQITPLLTPDQQTKFAEMVQKFEAGPAGGGKRHLGRRHGTEAAADASPGVHADLMQRLTTQLGLTADQQTQVKPILDAAHAQIVATRQDTTLTPEQKFAKIKETMEAAHSQINGILTPAQQQQLEEMKANFRKGHRPPAPAASPATSGTSS